jgi:hypothetical protein
LSRAPRFNGECPNSREEQIQMTAGWMVTVAVFKDDGKLGHVTYAVAITDAGEAVNAALRTCAGEAAVVTPLREIVAVRLREPLG